MSVKPLGHKAYGSIPHLPNSRLGPGDYHCHEGQARICTERARDRHDRIIVTEKLDGSNVSVANVNGQIIALTRAGYVAATSPYDQHHVFDKWVAGRVWRTLPVGYRISGEWMYHAHGTIYRPDAPLICFDAFDASNHRLPHDDARALFDSLGMVGAHVVSDGPPATVEAALSSLGDLGFHGAQEQVEGAVWRVERHGKFDFLAKFVRPEKVDGKYLESISGKPAIVMINPQVPA